ncbi:carbohydrate ABC transporter permease [Actinomyces vulturis]|uniref:carbohydrate ABC transporter permease n=1 Tax=Actinomyces vulturis TaxID=1857645 RepID=UPI00082E4CC8|nr:sugar ABC transporter permease [Actinomyces vulturis]
MAATATAEVKTKQPKASRSVSSAKLKRRNTIAGWTFILPNFVGFALFTLIPVLTLFYTAFTKWNVFGDPKFVGLENFNRLIGDDKFWTAFWNTMYYTVIHVPLTLGLSLGLALLLNQKLRGLAFFRAAAFFPYFTSIVAVAQVWNMLLSPDKGLVNQFIRLFGVTDAPGWTTSTTWAMPAVIIVATWREMGYYMVLFLAGLQVVPPELYEAARMDGAGAWRRFWNVTIPCLRPTTFFVLVMLTIGSFKILDLILVMTNGGPGTSTLVLSQYVYQAGFTQGEFGYASSIALVLFLVCLVVTVVQFMYNRKQEA